MSNYIFQATPYDRPRQLLAALGSFWSEVYSGSDQVASYTLAKCQVEQQAIVDLLELIASMSRFTVPLFHRDNWYALRILESQRNSSLTALAKYDSTAIYDTGLRYDVPETRVTHSFPIPEDLVGAELVMNRFTEPSLVYHKDSDFQLEPGAIVFRSNPFDDPRVAKRQVYSGGDVVDREALLWVFRGEFDWDTVYRQFGYVLGLRLKSSQSARDFLNAVYDALVIGTTRQQIYTAFSAMTGIPLVLGSKEIVKFIVMDETHRTVITDQQVYHFNLSTTITVQQGDTLYAGDSMTDGLVITEFHHGITPADLPALVIGRNLTAACFHGDLIFENRDVPLEVITNDPSGFTKLKFGIGGFPLDVERFFDELHERGVAEALQPVDECADEELITYPANTCEEETRQGRRGTLAHLLDRREVRTGEPTAASLPRTINPLQFLVQNVLRNNAFMVRIKVGSRGSERIGLHNMRQIRKIIPPHTALLLVVELTAVAESVTVERVQEELSKFVGMETLQDDVPVEMVDDSRIGLRVISGTCQ